MQATIAGMKVFKLKNNIKYRIIIQKISNNKNCYNMIFEINKKLLI